VPKPYTNRSVKTVRSSGRVIRFYRSRQIDRTIHNVPTLRGEELAREVMATEEMNRRATGTVNIRFAIIANFTETDAALNKSVI
jgi:hypothetical protein